EMSDETLVMMSTGMAGPFWREAFSPRSKQEPGRRREGPRSGRKRGRKRAMRSPCFDGRQPVDARAVAGPRELTAEARLAQGDPAPPRVSPGISPVAGGA